MCFWKGWPVSLIANLKAELLAAIAASDADGRYDEAGIDAVHGVIVQLLPHSPIPRPLDEQEKIAGPWKSLFAQFGPKHTAGKPITHETSFKLLSFNNLPDAPLRLLEIEQEIHSVSKDYNNVHLVETIDGSLRAHLIVFGHYDIAAETPQRYGIVDQGPERERHHGFEADVDQQQHQQQGAFPAVTREVRQQRLQEPADTARWRRLEHGCVVCAHCSAG